MKEKQCSLCRKAGVGPNWDNRAYTQGDGWSLPWESSRSSSVVTSQALQGWKQDPNTLRIFLPVAGLAQFARTRIRGFLFLGGFFGLVFALFLGNLLFSKQFWKFKGDAQEVMEGLFP